MISAGSGTVRCFLPLPRTRSRASANFKSSSCSDRISHERRPSSNMRPTTARLLEAESEGDMAVGTTVADRAAGRIGVLEMGMAAAGDLLSEMESIQATNYGQAMIHGLRSRLGLLAQLMADIIQQCGLRDF